MMKNVVILSVLVAALGTAAPAGAATDGPISLTSSAPNVRLVHVTPRVRVEGSLAVTAAVRPARARCRGEAQAVRPSYRRVWRFALPARFSAAGRASWRVRIPENAAGGRWHVTVSCWAGEASHYAERAFTVTRPPLPTVIVEKSGFSFGAIEYDGERFRYVSFGLVLRNTSALRDAIDVRITTNVISESGGIVAQDLVRLEGIPAGSTYYFGGDEELRPTHVPARLQTIVTVEADQKRALVLPAVANIALFPTPFPTVTELQAEVRNDTSQLLCACATVSAVAFDAAGDVITGGRSSLGAALPRGATALSEVYLGGVGASQAATVQVSVEPNYTSR
jgi:hypothetical protein